ncbi:MAG TPA: DUF1572 family protein [Tepidisphaeraceae bacterium]|nr:DUF1572 family protein [Tepidisphaeraceae bacterium]
MAAYDLNASYSDLSLGFATEAAKTLRGAAERIEHCINQLSDDQIWWRPRPEMNAIGNLILHLCGNVGQWIIAPIEQTAANRNRPAEFSHRDVIPRAALLERFRSTVNRAASAIETLSESKQMLERRRVQGHDTCILAAIFHSVCHFEGHAQEIVSRTRQMLGDKYQFLWVPSTPEQQSAGSADPPQTASR